MMQSFKDDYLTGKEETAKETTRMMIEKLENDMQETIPEQNATSPLHQDLDRTRSILQKMKDIRENKSKKDEPEQELPVTPYSPFFDVNSDFIPIEP